MVQDKKEAEKASFFLAVNKGKRRLFCEKRIRKEEEHMSKLQCTAQNCMYNKEKNCCRGEILVEGREATDISETCCGSFHERTCGCSNDMQTARQEVEIRCEAKDCRHNSFGQCKASSVGISGTHACHCEETECTAFRRV